MPGDRRGDGEQVAGMGIWAALLHRPAYVRGFEAGAGAEWISKHGRRSSEQLEQRRCHMHDHK